MRFGRFSERRTCRWPVAASYVLKLRSQLSITGKRLQQANGVFSFQSQPDGGCGGLY